MVIFVRMDKIKKHRLWAQ